MKDKDPEIIDLTVSDDEEKDTEAKSPKLKKAKVAEDTPPTLPGELLEIEKPDTPEAVVIHHELDSLSLHFTPGSDIVPPVVIHSSGPHEEVASSVGKIDKIEEIEGPLGKWSYLSEEFHEEEDKKEEVKEEEVKEISFTPESESSGISDIHKLAEHQEGFFLKSSIIQLHFGFSKRYDASRGNLSYILQFGSDRPAGIVNGSGQGRHISPYSLMQEALINRINGKKVEELPKAIMEFLQEYITPGQNTEKKLKKYMTSIGKKYQGNFLNREKRVAVFNELEATNELFKIKLSEEQQLALQEACGKEFYDAFLKLQAANQEMNKQKLTPIKARNHLKQGNIIADQELLLEAIKGTLTILNKMDMVAFSGKKSEEALEKEAKDVKGIMKKLRAKNLDSSKYLDEDGNITVEKVASDLYNLLDFPMIEVVEDWKKEWKEEKSEKFIEEILKSNGELRTLREKSKHDKSAGIEYNKKVEKALSEKWDKMEEKEGEILEKEFSKIFQEKTHKYFLPILARHIKLVYDAFPIIREIFKNEKSQEEVIEGFLLEVLDKGNWSSKLPEGTNLESLYFSLSSILAINSDEQQCAITTKFNTKISGTLNNAIIELEKYFEERSKDKQTTLDSFLKPKSSIAAESCESLSPRSPSVEH